METLREQFKPHLGLPKARFTCFLMMVLPKSTKRGNSRRCHRIKLMEEVLSILPRGDIRALTIDREFVGKRWLAWLKLMEIPFVVRIKANTKVGGKPASWWSHRNRWKRFSDNFHEVFGGRYHFAAKRIRKGRDTHVAVTSYGFQGAEALEIYWQRWGIETLFSHLKRRGYQFEDTHMTKGERISKLMGVLAVAFALSYQWGRKLEREAGIKLKSHGHRAKSIFRQGLESLLQMLHLPSNLADRLSEFLDEIVRRPLVRRIVV